MLLPWRKPPIRPDLRPNHTSGRICRNCLNNRHSQCRDERCTCIHKEPWGIDEQQRVESRIRRDRQQAHEADVQRVALEEKEMLERFFGRSA